MRSINLFFILALLGWSEVKAQSVNFRYDNMGNRKYRGTSLLVENGRIGETDSLIGIALPFSINVFPNPTSGLLFINIMKYPSDSISSYRLTDLNGMTLLSKTIWQGENTEDLSPYPDGIYLLQVYVGKEKRNWKIIKQ